MNTISIPVPGVNTQAYSSVNTGIKPANVTAHIPPTGIIRNGKILIKVLDEIWHIYRKNECFVAGSDYLANKFGVTESTIGRALSRLDELEAIRIVIYPGLLREITPLISVTELRTLLSTLLRTALRSASPYRASVSEVAKKSKTTTVPEPNPETVPAVGCSFASQREKEKIPTPSRKSQSESAPKPLNVSPPPATVAPPAMSALPESAAQLAEEGKVKPALLFRYLRKAGAPVLGLACCAIIEHSQKKAIESYEKALWSAVHDEWEPSEGFMLPYRRGVVSADYVKPAPDAPASCWPGAKPDPIHRREYSRNHETGKDEPVSGKCRGLITRMVNWTYRPSRGMSDNEWFDVARSIVRSGSYLHLPMDWEAPRVEGVK